MPHAKKNPVALSIGILITQEEPALAELLGSLLRQSVFERLCVRHEQCELLVIAQAGCDETVAHARRTFEQMHRQHAWRDSISARVIEIPETGLARGWNRFVHEFSAVEARFLCFVDPHIALHHRDTLFNLGAILERRPHVAASTARELSTLLLKERRSLRERWAGAQAVLRRAGAVRLSERLYCLRAGVARNLFLPGDLAGAEVDFINEAIRTESFTREARGPRVLFAPEAACICAPRATGTALAQLSRRAFGRAALHVLLGYVKSLSWHDRLNLGDTLRRHEARDAEWLKKLIALHLRRRPFFWQLFPGALTLRFRQLLALPGAKKLTHLPAACAASFLTVLACVTARRAWRGQAPAASVAAQPGSLAAASRARAE